MLMARKRRKGTWARRLQDLRELLGITQAEAAARIGVTTSAWVSWENEQRTPSRAAQQLLRREFPDMK